MEYCINKNTNEKIFAFDVENEYGIKDLGIERKLRLGGEREELICPECKTPVILRAGEIKIPHFAHKIKTKECFYSTYTYNENRQKALKILYDLLKKFENIEILEISKKFSENGVIDILIEDKNRISGNKKCAILLKNTMENYEKWKKFHNELLYNDITPIYFNYGTYEEIKKYDKSIDKYFFRRNLAQLSGNRGVRLIDTTNRELYTICTLTTIDDKNIIINLEKRLNKIQYEGFLEFFFNEKGMEKYRLDYTEEKDKLIDFIENKRIPFFILTENEGIFLVVHLEEEIYDYDDTTLNPYCLTVINFNYFLMHKSLGYEVVHYYPDYNILKHDDFLYWNNITDTEELKEFIESSDYGNFKFIPLENCGNLRKNIEDIIEKTEILKSKIYLFNYISNKGKRFFFFLNKINELDEFNLSMINSTDMLEELISLFKELYVIQFSKKYLNGLIKVLDKNLKIEGFEGFLNILKSLENQEDNSFIKILLSFEELEKYKIRELFIKIFGNEWIFGRYNNFEKDVYIESYYSYSKKIFNLLNVNSKLKTFLNPSVKDLELKKFDKYLQEYYEEDDLEFFKYRITNNINSKLLEEFFIRYFPKIIEDDKVELIKIFLSKKYDITKKLIIKDRDIFGAILNKSNNLFSNYISLVDLIKKKSNIQLILLLVEYGYKEYFNISELSLAVSKFFEKDKEYIKVLLKTNLNLNEISQKNTTSLFYNICKNSNNIELINYCIKMGANLNAKFNNKETPLKILKNKVEKGLIDKNLLQISLF